MLIYILHQIILQIRIQFFLIFFDLKWMKIKRKWLVASQQGTLTLPDTWFRPPFWDLLMLQLLRPNSSNLPCLYSTFHLEYPLVLARFYLSSFIIFMFKLKIASFDVPHRVTRRAKLYVLCIIKIKVILLYYGKSLNNRQTMLKKLEQ